MTTHSQQLEQESQSFYTMMENVYDALPENDSLQKLRLKAWEHFLELGLPNSRTSEVFRYLRMRNLYAKSYSTSVEAQIDKEAFSSHIYPECKGSCIVFVNGFYRPELSHLEKLPQRIVITSLSDAYRTFGTFLNNQWHKSLKDETDPFMALNGALHQSAGFVYVPPKTIVNVPLQILNVVDVNSQPTMISPRLQLFVGAQSELEILSTQVILSGEDYFVNFGADFAIEDDAHVRYFQITCDQPSDIWHFDALRASLKRNSTLKTVSITEGSAGIRYDYRVSLNGENGDALLNGMWMLADRREAHTHVLMDHQAPNCHSLQLFKGALNDLSRSSFEGKILVRQAAQKTDAFQLNNNLLLSDRANADSKPNLEIFADDVKASHGATFGQLDAEQLFVLRSRGIDEREAKNILVYGFCKEVIDLITVPSLKKEINRHAQEYLYGA